ncbi:MAG: hypothetical protein IJS14_13220 [Lentisphaeria bacterium]|nr:hypothetical protein [Lentisphaeria bacterium]
MIKRTVFALSLLLASVLPACIADKKCEAAKPDGTAGRMVARTDHDVSPVWKAKQIYGKDFRVIMGASVYDPPADPAGKAKYDAELRPGLYVPLSKLPPEMRKYLDIPAFRDLIIFSGYVGDEAVIKNPDGTYTFDLDVISRNYTEKDQPFYFSIKRFTRPYKPGYKHFFWEETFRHPDREKYLKWKKKHPNLIGVNTLTEWGNEANILYNHRLPRYVKEAKLPPEQAAKVRARWKGEFTDRRDYVNNHLKRLFDRHASTWFDDPSVFYLGEGMWCINHLAAYWGATNLLVHETSRNLRMWQVQMIFNRGAARQFGAKWGWYVATVYTGYNSKHQQSDGHPAAWYISPKKNPAAGISLNARERVYYYAWLCGVNILQREDVSNNFWDRTKKGPERWKPVYEGKMYIDFANFVRANPDRGTTYTPVALLIPYAQGACRNIQPAFGKFPYLKSDNMYHSLIATIYPQFDDRKYSKKGVEMTLRNSKYGDIFDVLTPDFPDPTALRKTLPAYKVAILSGGYEKHPAMAEALREYVRNGGTLVLNTVQLNNFDPAFTGVKLTGKTVKDDGYVLDKVELAGAKVLSALPDGTPVFTAFDQGKGRVIVATPRWLVPDFEDGSEESKKVLGQTASGIRQFKYTRELLDKILEEVLPIEVSGDVLYGLNKTKDGWLIYMINNKGINKYTDTPAEFDSKQTSKVTVNLKAIQAGKAHDLCSGEDFPISGGKFTASVAPGRYRILKLVK